jgi:hypothetical protein
MRAGTNSSCCKAPRLPREVAGVWYRKPCSVVDEIDIAEYSGKATSGQFQASIVFAKMPTGWQLVCNQITPVTSP